MFDLLWAAFVYLRQWVLCLVSSFPRQVYYNIVVIAFARINSNNSVLPGAGWWLEFCFPRARWWSRICWVVFALPAFLGTIGLGGVGPAALLAFLPQTSFGFLLLPCREYQLLTADRCEVSV